MPWGSPLVGDFHVGEHVHNTRKTHIHSTLGSRLCIRWMQLMALLLELASMLHKFKQPENVQLIEQCTVSSGQHQVQEHDPRRAPSVIVQLTGIGLCTVPSKYGGEAEGQFYSCRTQRKHSA